MDSFRVAFAIAALAAILAAGGAGAQGGRAPSPTGYWPSSSCAGCHPRTVEQHMQSHHETSFRNPLFQAQYFEELLPRASRDPSLLQEARSCTACHAPVAWSFRRSPLSGPMPADPSMSGVTCDLCHTISGYDGPTPGNGNFVSAPSDRKLGPFPSETNWHHAYSELQTKSEFCATCHEAVNHRNVPVKTTYSEWKKSPFAARGVQCQDCHMTRGGFLSAGRPQFDSGRAAEGALLGSPVRDRLYTHRFPGAHSRSQLEGAITLSFAKLPERVRAGGTASLSLLVDNQRTGHKMPTGSADLRLLWLELTARSGDRTARIPARTKALGSYAVAGSGEMDEALVLGDVPPGSRMYRAVFYGADRRQTLSSFDAVQIVWDNRLEPGERRVEHYDVALPPEFGGRVRLTARLVYLSYPGALARHLEVAAAEPVEIASTSADLEVLPAPAPDPKKR